MKMPTKYKIEMIIEPKIKISLWQAVKMRVAGEKYFAIFKEICDFYIKEKKVNDN